MADIFLQLSQRYKTPYQVQKLLRNLEYNTEETMRSALQVWNHKKAHCMEAAFLAAAILKRRGHPPHILCLDSADDIAHIVFLFRAQGRWGAVARSKEEGLHGRAPSFRSVRDLAWSYFDPYVDDSGRVTGYTVTDLDSLGKGWEDSSSQLWELENKLFRLPFKKINASERRYRKAFRIHSTTGHPKLATWW